MKKNKGLIASIIILLVFGAFFGCFSIITFNQSLTVKKYYTKAEATITQVNHYDEIIYVSFDAESGRVVNAPLKDYDSSWQLGKKLSIRYNPHNVYDIHVESSLNTLPIIMGSLAILFLGVSLGCIIGIRVNNKKINWLKENGQKIYAKITDVSQKTSGIMYNGNVPYTVECAYKLSGQVVFFKQNYPKLDSFNIFNKLVAIYYDPNNLKKYFIDIDDMHDDYSNEN